MTNSSTATESSQLPVIAGHEITTDEHGRFNLNTIHKASGAPKKKLPKYWAALDGTKALVRALETKAEMSALPLQVNHGGRFPGTFAHELLAVSYAGWISPEFHLEVMQVFIDYRTGNLKQPSLRGLHEAKQIGKTTTKDRAPLKQLVNTIVDARTRRGHPSDYSSAWREINGYLGIESIQDATHEQIETGITFARRVLEGELCTPQVASTASADEFSITLKGQECGSLFLMVHYAHMINEIWRTYEVGKALGLLQSPVAGRLHEMIGDLGRHKRNISMGHNEEMREYRSLFGMYDGLPQYH